MFKLGEMVDLTRIEALRKEIQKRMLNHMITSVETIHKDLRSDGRCKHGLLPMQCSYCAGMPMTKYAQSVVAAWIR